MNLLDKLTTFQMLETTMGDHLEQKAEVKRLLLSSETAAITARAREREVETLLQQNQEVIVHSLTHTSRPLSLSLSHSLPLVPQYSTEMWELRQQLESLRQEMVRLGETSAGGCMYNVASACSYNRRVGACSYNVASACSYNRRVGACTM